MVVVYQYHFYSCNSSLFFNPVATVTKPMCHPFRSGMSHMCYVCEYMCYTCESCWIGIVPFWTASECPRERDIYDERRVRTRFRCHNPVVLRCTIVGRADGEQRGYAAEISFGHVTRHKYRALSDTLGWV